MGLTALGSPRKVPRCSLTSTSVDTHAAAVFGRRSGLTAPANFFLASQLLPPVSAEGVPNARKGFPSQTFCSTVVDESKAGGEAIVLNNGMVFPKASFGLQAYGFGGDAKGRDLTKKAVKVGYRNFFASTEAHNQQGFAMGIMDSGVARKDVFICGSVNTRRSNGFDRAYQDTKKGCEENLRAMAVGGITYLDMIMLDYPASDCDSIRGQWRAFQEMLDSGQTKSIAVSNFGLTQLDCIMKDPTLSVPVVNQLRFNLDAYSPFDTKLIIDEMRKRGIVVQAWSPLRVSSSKKLTVAKEIGQRYGKSAAQVLLRWVVDVGATYTTQSSRADHLAENIDIFDFHLTPDDLERLVSTRS
eukprot:CAMPEP_0117500510 /NCGR_PEP_ID=MMETSP0784-20121206/22812_1 /TAXON_ID=39447 /ORGANISM="" /LENGTH=355 /DNA_ID=CAMNT_0005295719 /DNA_START=321 /DNA_END=1388 /DNA_ORIENTATION=-